MDYGELGIMSITVVNKYAEKNHIYCGRGSALGNPFPMVSESDRDAVCGKYEDWFYGVVDESSFLSLVDNPDSRIRPNDPTKLLIHIYVEAAKGDVNLGCYCAPKRCHCDTIKNFIELKLEESWK